MEDERDKPDATAAPPLSAEFLSGGTAAGLEKIRARLLDLTNRNRLLNFRHTSASSIRIVDADLDTVFERLLNGEEIPFRPVPEPKLPPIRSNNEDEIAKKPLAADYAEFLGWCTAYDLTTPSTHNADSLSLPVLHYVEDLETLTRKIGSAAKTAIEESGTNMLYLTMGFLEWYESDDSRQTHIAPLVTVPVALNRGAAKGKGFEATLEYSGEDFGVNLSLVEKMRRDFAVEISAFEEDDTPSTYFERFEPILAQRQRWKIRRHITLSLLSFGRRASRWRASWASDCGSCYAIKSTMTSSVVALRLQRRHGEARMRECLCGDVVGRKGVTGKMNRRPASREGVRTVIMVASDRRDVWWATP